MGLEKTFQHLATQSQKLNDALNELCVSIGDHPREGDVVLTDMLADAVEDLLGWQAELEGAAAEAQRAVGHPLDLDRARRALALCQEQLNRSSKRFSSEITAYERMEALTGLGRERGGEWQDWADIVKETIDRCQEAMYDVNDALFQCWQEMTERLGLTTVSVHSTNIGQQVTVPKEQEYARERYP